MKYEKVIEGRFVRRVNRFIAEVLMDEVLTTVHVKNTGRCKELFIEGVKVYLEPANNPNRKTKFSLVALYKEDMLINIDSQIPNKAAKEGLENNPYLREVFGELSLVKTEVNYGSSRFDLYYENHSLHTKGFIEVKGVTLEDKGVAMFPDAPTKRGTKHVRELIASQEEGYQNYILFVIQLKPVTYFTPNKIRDPEFSQALIKANEEGVGILCFDSIIEPDSITLDRPIDIVLQN
jgi:sugar fermentation stimulation protein A